MVQSYELSMNQIVLDNCYSTFRRFETFIELGLLCNTFRLSERERVRTCVRVRHMLSPVRVSSVYL